MATAAVETVAKVIVGWGGCMHPWMDHVRDMGQA
jgi:hypothetical protein